MRTIHKYHIPFGDEAMVMMPKGAEILKFGIQGTMPNGYPDICVWAMVDTEAEAEVRRFRIFGTGHPLPKNCMKYAGCGKNPDREYEFEYWDTLFDGRGVWHMYVQYIY